MKAQEIMVGWNTKPELGVLPCEVTARYSDGLPKKARWANGRDHKVVFLMDQGHYVWAEKH